MRRSQHTGQDIFALFLLSFFGIACSLNGFYFLNPHLKGN
jgi:hypothetical protein